MKALRMMMVTILVSCLALGIIGCGREKEETQKIQRISDSPLPEGGYKAGISGKHIPAAFKANSSMNVQVSVKNIGSVVWPSKGQPNALYKIHFSYHWLDKEGRVIVFDGVRTSLPYDISPNQEVILDAQVAAPNHSGEFILELDMVQEGVAWFKEKGNQTARVDVKVE